MFQCLCTRTVCPCSQTAPVDLTPCTHTLTRGASSRGNGGSDRSWPWWADGERRSTAGLMTWTHHECMSQTPDCVLVCPGWSIGWQTDWIHDGITDVTGGPEGGDPDPSGRLSFHEDSVTGSGESSRVCQYPDWGRALTQHLCFMLLQDPPSLISDPLCWFCSS